MTDSMRTEDSANYSASATALQRWRAKQALTEAGVSDCEPDTAILSEYEELSCGHITQDEFRNRVAAQQRERESRWKYALSTIGFGF